MKPLILLLPALFIFLFGCQSTSNKNEKLDDVFIPTCKKPDIVGSGKSTIIKDEPKWKHKKRLGKSGCAPKDKLVLNDDNYFCDFSVQIDSEEFFYIPYKTVYVHKRDGKIKSFSPGYYRSSKSEVLAWNIRIDSCEFMTKQYGVGICTLDNYELINDGNDRWFFENKALIFGKTICPDKPCL